MFEACHVNISRVLERRPFLGHRHALRHVMDFFSAHGRAWYVIAFHELRATNLRLRL